jgi:hypothetical protein
MVAAAAAVLVAGLGGGVLVARRTMSDSEAPPKSALARSRAGAVPAKPDGGAQR